MLNCKFAFKTNALLILWNTDMNFRIIITQYHISSIENESKLRYDFFHSALIAVLETGKFVCYCTG